MFPAFKAAVNIFRLSGESPTESHKIAKQFWQLVKAALEK